jgi:fumarate hydratase subunit beta
MIELTTPITEEQVRSLKLGDIVYVSGIMVTARDAGHKLMVEERPAFLDELLKGGVIYHCGPVVRRDDGKWSFVAAGPTTSAREEPYQAKVIESYGVRAVIGKGGMGPKTLEGCKKFGAVYLSAIGGCGTQIARAVKEVIAVHKLEEFGTPEAFWVCKIDKFPVVVTMDANGGSLHDQIDAASKKRFQELLAQ